MEKVLYPEEQMHIEKKALSAFLFAADFGNAGVEHLLLVLEQLKQRLNEANNPKT